MRIKADCVALMLCLCPLASAVAGDGTRYLGGCGTHGDEGYLVPGTDTCLRISGSVSTEYAARLAKTPRHAPPSTANPGRDLSRSLVGGRIAVDVRMPTEYGPVRAYVSLRKPLGTDHP